MLGSRPGDISQAPAQEDACPQPDGLIIRVIEQGAQLPGGTVIGVADSGLQGAHVGVNGFVGEIDGAIVILVTVSGVAQDGVGERFETDLFLYAGIGIACGAVSRRPKMNLFTGQEVFDDMPAAVPEFTRMDFVERIVLRKLGGADVSVDGGDTAIGGNVIEPYP